MDAGNALFYAAVCGALAGAAPLFANRLVRICIGGVIGVNFIKEIKERKHA